MTVVIEAEDEKGRAGRESYMITNQPVTVTYRVEEEQILRECSAHTEWEDLQHRKTVLPVAEWKETGAGKITTQKLE